MDRVCGDFGCMADHNMPQMLVLDSGTLKCDDKSHHHRMNQMRALSA